MTTDDQNKLKEIGASSFSAIEELVDALHCDYERLQELQDEKDALEDDVESAEGDDRELAELALASWLEVDGEELASLRSLAGECNDEEQARERIQEDALSVEVRSGWASIGETLTPEQFCILLATGGPAVRIRGELDEHQEPQRAWLEVQDWGTPWTQYFGAEQYTLLAYAQCFYFGE